MNNSRKIHIMFSKNLKSVVYLSENKSGIRVEKIRFLKLSSCISGLDERNRDVLKVVDDRLGRKFMHPFQ